MTHRITLGACGKPDIENTVLKNTGAGYIIGRILHIKYDWSIWCR